VPPYYFFDPFNGSSLDTTNNWDAANGVTVSGGFMHTTRSTGQIQSQAGKINYPPSPVRWGAETRFMVTNDGQDISQASLLVGANPGFGSRDFSIALANGQGNNPALFGIGYGDSIGGGGFTVPSRSFNRGQFYTVKVFHEATGAPGYTDDIVSIYVDDVLYASYTAYPDSSGTYGAPPVIRLASDNGYVGDFDYVAVGVPEPTAIGVFAAVAGAALLRRRRRSV
jgi:hypothetical protein